MGHLAIKKTLKNISLVGFMIVGVCHLASADIADTYQKSCAKCHDSGVLNAPKKGDIATWQNLQSKKGMAVLIKSTRQGMPQMPAMGLCQTCSDKDFQDLIQYMSK